jgi:hypothetical protein
MLDDGYAPPLRSGSPVGGSLHTQVTHRGKQLSFCLTSFAVPVATREVAETIEAIAGPDLQRIPLRIVGYSGYEVLTRFESCDALTSHVRSS